MRHVRTVLACEPMSSSSAAQFAHHRRGGLEAAVHPETCLVVPQDGHHGLTSHQALSSFFRHVKEPS